MLRLHLLQLDQYFDVLLREVGTFTDGRLAALDDNHLKVSRRTDCDYVGPHLLKQLRDGSARVSVGAV